MKVNAINSMNYMTGKVSFKNTAVPYPEYENAYYYVQQPSSFEKLLNRFSALFTPEVTQKSQAIKDGINKIYDSEEAVKGYSRNPNSKVFSVIA